MCWMLSFVLIKSCDNCKMNDKHNTLFWWYGISDNNKCQGNWGSTVFQCYSKNQGKWQNKWIFATHWLGVRTNAHILLFHNCAWCPGLLAHNVEQFQVPQSSGDITHFLASSSLPYADSWPQPPLKQTVTDERGTYLS